MSDGLDDNRILMSLGDHLLELRKRVLRCVIAIGVGLGISFWFGIEITVWLSRPVLNAMQGAGVADPKLLARSIQEPFMVYTNVSLLVGFVIASPYVFWELWQFVAAGLTAREKRWVKIFAPVTVGLFLIGTAFAYYFVTWMGMRFLAEFAMEMKAGGMPIDYRPGISESVSMVVTLSVIMGLVFQLPIVIMFLSALRVVRVSSLKKLRKPFILIAFIVGAVLTPSVDPVTQTVVSLPLVVLYEVGLQAANIMEKRRARRAAEETANGAER
jgi:sec-independent protein translocase protein TatC